MEEIEKIISAISEATGLDRFSIIHGKTEECKDARGILCHIIMDNDTSLMSNLASILNKSKKQCEFISILFRDKINENNDLLAKINEVLAKLGKTAITTRYSEKCRQKEKEELIRRERKKSRINAKRLFNIVYTTEDEKRMEQAMIAASLFMRKYKNIGLIK